nr:hypothetical protein [Brevibacterium sp. CS2]
MRVRRNLHRLGYFYRVDIAPEPNLRRQADIVFAKTHCRIPRWMLLAWLPRSRPHPVQEQSQLQACED